MLKIKTNEFAKIRDCFDTHTDCPGLGIFGVLGIVIGGVMLGLKDTLIEAGLQAELQTIEGTPQYDNWKEADAPVLFSVWIWNYSAFKSVSFPCDLMDKIGVGLECLSYSISGKRETCAYILSFSNLNFPKFYTHNFSSNSADETSF